MAMMPRLLGISPGDHGCGRTLTWIVQGAVQGGLRGLILREPHLSKTAYVELARRLSPLLGPGLVLHGSHGDSVRIAARAGWGLHMPASMEWEGIREQTKGWLGASCHTAEDIQDAIAAQVDYITLGPVFAPMSKHNDEQRCIGLDDLRDLIEGVELPIFAVGGINRENVERIVQLDVYGVGSMGFLFPPQADADLSNECTTALLSVLD